ncbi:MAG TPA: site-2 protease family protein [Acidimicrobiia bacterium]|nr:site-2 protease family protein [Acidimicrobiia bacterium]
MFGRNSWAIGRLGGIEIRIDPSWSFIAFLIAYSFFLAIQFRFDGMGTAEKVILSAGMALIFFASVLLHELAHSWVAVARGVEVENITLFLFGGATKADLETKEPTDEFVIAVVGPLTSVALAAGFWLVALAFGPGTVGGFVAGHLGWINLALGVFNMVPGFPLDGGRVLRSIVWRRSGDLVGATRVAARGGQFVGYGLIGLGVLQILFLGALVGGLWFIAIGWFLSQAAQASFLQLQMRRVLAEVPASRIMTGGIVEIPGHLSIRQAVDDYFMSHDFNAFPVRDGERTVGILTMNAIRAIPQEEWHERTVRAEAEPLSDSCTVGPSEPLDEVVGKLMSGDLRRVVVVDHGQVTGIISPRDISRWLQRSQELGLTESTSL